MIATVDYGATDSSLFRASPLRKRTRGNIGAPLCAAPSCAVMTGENGYTQANRREQSANALDATSTEVASWRTISVRFVAPAKARLSMRRTRPSKLTTRRSVEFSNARAGTRRTLESTSRRRMLASESSGTLPDGTAFVAKARATHSPVFTIMGQAPSSAATENSTGCTMGFARRRTEYQSADRRASGPNSTSNSANVLMPILYHKPPTSSPPATASSGAKAGKGRLLKP